MELDLASIITATGAAVAVVMKALSVRRTTRVRDLEGRVGDLEQQLLDMAGWAHAARVQAAAAGCRLPAIPRPRVGTDAAQREDAS